MASRGINKVIVLGNLGQDPVISQGTTGSTVANISVATSIVWIDKQTGQKNERTEWHRVVFFAKLAEIVQQYLRKGSKVYIEGSLRTEKWTDNTGQERYTTKIIAREMQMLDSKKDFVESSPPPVTSAPTQPIAASSEFEDDIPF